MSNVATLTPLVKPLAYPMAGCPCKYVRNNDFLRADVRCSVASVTVQFTGLLLTSWGDYVPLQFNVAPTSDRASTTATLKLTEGFLYHLQARISGGTVRRGQCFVKCGIQQGDNDLAILHTTLLSDYATLDYEPVYPGSPIRSPLEGKGIMRTVTGTNPGAGSEISETVPTNAHWFPRSIVFSLAVANSGSAREVQFLIDDGSSVFYQHNLTAAPAINATTVIELALGAVEQGTAQNLNTANWLPEIRMPQAYRFRTNTPALVAGDDYSAPIFLVEEWIEE